MTRLFLIGLGLWMIGDGWPANSPGGVLKVVGGILVLLVAIGVSF